MLGSNKRMDDHSILSLVISLSVYVIRPSTRAASFQKAYQVLSVALVLSFDNPDGAIILKSAIIKGEKILASQATLDPQ